MVTVREDVPGACEATACAAIDALLVKLVAKEAQDEKRRLDRAG